LWQRLKEPIDNKILEWLQISVWKRKKNKIKNKENMLWQENLYVDVVNLGNQYPTLKECAPNTISPSGATIRDVSITRIKIPKALK